MPQPAPARHRASRGTVNGPRTAGAAWRVPSVSRRGPAPSWSGRRRQDQVQAHGLTGIQPEGRDDVRQPDVKPEQSRRGQADQRERRLSFIHHPQRVSHAGAATQDGRASPAAAWRPAPSRPPDHWQAAHPRWLAARRRPPSVRPVRSRRRQPAALGSADQEVVLELVLPTMSDAGPAKASLLHPVEHALDPVERRELLRQLRTRCAQPLQVIGVLQRSVICDPMPALTASRAAPARARSPRTAP